MSEKIIDNVTLIIATMIIGVVLVILGIALQSLIMVLVGGLL